MPRSRRQPRRQPYNAKQLRHAAEERLLPVSAKVLTGGDAAAYEQFVQDEVQRLYRFVVQQLEYHDALNDLAANEVSPYEIIDEAFARVIAAHGATPDKQQLTPYRRLQTTALKVIDEQVAQLEERERRETSVEGNYQDPLEEDGFRTLGEHVLDFWQLDQDLSQQDLLPDETPTPAEIEDMKARQNEIYAALNALPRRAREDFVLLVTDGWTVAELAKLHGVPAGTIKQELRATQAALLARLRDRSLLENRPPRQQPHEHDRGHV